MKVLIPFMAIGFYLFIPMARAQQPNHFSLLSPNHHLEIMIDASTGKLQWSMMYQNRRVIKPSRIALTWAGQSAAARALRIQSATTSSVDNRIAAIHYKKDDVIDHYNQLTIRLEGGYGVLFRAYDDGAAYRFFTDQPDSLVITAEQAEVLFDQDDSLFIPYVNNPHLGDMFQCSFENVYQHLPFSGLNKDTLSFAPVLVQLGAGKLLAITEADLEDYPGMFLQAAANEFGLQGRFAPFVTAQMQSPENPALCLATKRADFLGKTAGKRDFPWRVLVIADQDKDLLNNDMVYRLAAPSRLKDMSWIKPGKVAWDWWSDWNISHVNFQAGINTATYKYFIDFAAANGLEYILLDAGWSDSRDIMRVVPGIDLQEIIDYARARQVGVWLWAGSCPLDQKMEEAFSHYASMGVKGFKIDFMDRDDQAMVAFYYRTALKAAQYHLMLDFHGAYKPTGLMRTYPNVMNFEGVHGMEQEKWSNPDMPRYDVSIPFVRMIAGPMDYTPGAMRNANKENFRPVYANPMSQGTRCHQLAMYILFEAPLEMLSDNPSTYMREPESVHFMASIPTVFNQTQAIAGKVGEYAALARSNHRSWYLGAMTNWNTRDLTISLDFLGPGHFQAEIFKDGVNADREATDYIRDVRTVTATDTLMIHMAKGGGFAARFIPVP